MTDPANPATEPKNPKEPKEEYDEVLEVDHDYTWILVGIMIALAICAGALIAIALDLNDILYALYALNNK